MDDLVNRLHVTAARLDEWVQKHVSTKANSMEAKLMFEAADRIEALERQVKAADALAEKLEGWIGVAATCAIESGVCRCGDDMERHSSPLDCGHPPVDHGAYAATQLIDATTSALAAYRATKEGGEK